MRALKTKKAEVETQENAAEGKEAIQGEPRQKKAPSAVFAGIRVCIWGILAAVFAFLHVQIAAPFTPTVFLLAAAVFMLCALLAAIKYYKRGLKSSGVIAFAIISGATLLYACVDMVINRGSKSLLGWIFAAKRDGIEYRLGMPLGQVNRCLFYANFVLFCAAALLLIGSICKLVSLRKTKNAAPAGPAVEERTEEEAPSEEEPRAEE